MDILMPGKKRKQRKSSASVTIKNSGVGRKISSAMVWKMLLPMTFLLACVYGLIATPKVIETISNQRVEQVLIEGEVNFVSEQEVLDGVSSFISKSLLLVNIDEIKKQLELMPWIRSVNIRRDWPDTLVLNVIEEKAIARWEEIQLLNQDGVIFSPTNIFGLENLAILSGPTGSERQVMEQYQLFSQLLYQCGLKIAKLNLNERSAWNLTLTNDVLINVGKTKVVERMKRLVEFSYSEVMKKMVTIESIDLRYTNGIAVKTKQNKVAEVVSL